MMQQLYACGKSLAVATGKSRNGLERVLLETDMTLLFCARRGADEAKSKPDPLMLQQILDELRAKYITEREFSDMNTEDFIVFAYKQGLRDSGARIRNYLTPMLTLADMELQGADADLKTECAKQIIENIDKIKHIDDISETA